MIRDETTGGRAPSTMMDKPPPAAKNLARKPTERRHASRLPSLTGLRIAAALLVFFNHVGLPLPHLRFLESDAAAFRLFDMTGDAGSLGVVFFFVLSGFVLTWSARGDDTARRFWRRRFVKVYPNYAITWALAMVLVASAYTPAGTALANLFMVHVWVPEFAVFSSVNEPSWSLGCEVLFYASFPLLHNLFKRIRAGHLKYWIAGTAAAVMATPLVTHLFVPDRPLFPGAALGAPISAEQYWFAYYMPATRMLDFALGMLVAQAVLRGRWFNIGMAWSALLLVGSYVACTFVPFLYAQRSMTIVPIIFLIAAAASSDIKGKSRFWSSRPMVWLGEISFAFYLIHFIVLTFLRKQLDGFFSVWETAGIVTLALGVTVLLSWALYALVERPITRRWSTSPGERRERDQDRLPAAAV
ncbi:acyltransferase family protein [Streptomyces luteolus]|uniref:Acyltransferase n=1 Tax=Streptomyces luteolus TaxID=3043615 RepID=A0ABT6T4P2_9ACTN|nr:acyltransferase [Streptomyces sp. B-S-A12]MDI3422596.1 acyltransferase [Streptomyces sp. B-S-A12]